jgi:ComF family protein
MNLGSLFHGIGCFFCHSTLKNTGISWCENCDPWLKPLALEEGQYHVGNGISKMECQSFLGLNTLTRKMLVSLKSKHEHAIVRTWWSAHKEELKQSIFDENALFVPVPLHPARLRERGFNQAEILCEQFTRTWGVEYNKNVVRRIRQNEHQAKLNRSERIGNSVNLFECVNPDLIYKRNIYLVDDVITTGSTLKSLSAELMPHGPQKIRGLSWVRAQAPSGAQDWMLDQLFENKKTTP